MGAAFQGLFVVFEHGRRRVIHLATTYHPSMVWVIHQLREATPCGRKPRYLFRDNDGIYGHGVRRFLDSCNIEEVRTAYKSPWQNPYIERFFGTLRRELLDHVIVLSESHLNNLLSEYFTQYYHCHRPHQGLEGDSPIPRPNRRSLMGHSSCSRFRSAVGFTIATNGWQRKTPVAFPELLSDTAKICPRARFSRQIEKTVH